MDPMHTDGGPPPGPPGGPPMGQPPMGQPPMGQPPMGQPPMGQPPMGQPPMGQPPMGPPGGHAAPEEPHAVELLPPQNTVFVNNLNEKVKEDELKQNLTAIFEQFGKIIQIVAMSSLKRRGQAFVIFDNQESAGKAIQAMQGFPFHGRPMRLNFSRSKSDVVAKKDGTYTPRVKPPLPPLPAKRKPAAKPEGAAGKHKKTKAEKRENAARMEEPNAILFLTNLPADVPEGQLEGLFSQFPGFKEVRSIPGRPDIAFVEYLNEHQSGVARESLQGFRITPTSGLRIAFAKK